MTYRVGDKQGMSISESGQWLSIRGTMSLDTGLILHAKKKQVKVDLKTEM